MTDTLYDRDFYAWANEQAALMHAGKPEQADIANLAEELATLARAERRHLGVLLEALIVSLLRWQVQPEWRVDETRRLVAAQRFAIEDHLRESPSLRGAMEEVIGRVWRPAVRVATHAGGLDGRRVPGVCPYQTNHLLDAGFFPD